MTVALRRDPDAKHNKFLGAFYADALPADLLNRDCRWRLAADPMNRLIAPASVRSGSDPPSAWGRL
jgi:hypothetical protein